MKTLLHVLIVAALIFLGTRTAAAAESPYVPLKINQTFRPQFPLPAKDAGLVAGSARLLVEISPEGTVTDSLVIAYTRREFAEEAERAVRGWKYEPSRLNGKAIGSRLELHFDFRVTGMIVRQVWFDQTAPPDPAAQYELRFWARSLKELDRMPRAVATHAPDVLIDAQGKRVAGRVLVKFYIDETGATRLPQVVSEDNAALGWEAVQAVGQWKFEPPLHDGRPTLALAHQSFVWPGEDR